MRKLNMTHLLSIIRYLSIPCVLFFFFSCGRDIDTSKDHLVFRYNEHANTSSLDPAFARNPPNIWPINQMFNSLLQLDEALNVQPDIAKRWDISDDGLDYTFYLRDDVYFHTSPLFGKDSTRTVLASDFAYSFDRLSDPKVASPGGWVLNNVDTYKAMNDSTFRIKLKKPFPAFLGLMTMQYVAVVPHEVADHYGNDFRSNPIGTGPFKFKLWEENVKLVMRRNERYYEKDENGQQLPYLEAIAVTFLPDKQSEFLQFVQGNLDFLNSLDNSYIDEILTAQGELREKYQSEVTMQKGPFLNTEYLGFYLEGENPAILSPLIRKAINLGFDRDKMMKYLRNGVGYPAYSGFIPKGMPGYKEIAYFSYDPDKAQALINQYKKETGDKKPSISIATNSQYQDFCEYIQRELQKLGLEVAIDVMPSSTLRQMKRSGTCEMFRGSWIADYPDPENYLSVFYTKNFTPHGPNYYHYRNAEFDSLFEKSFTIKDKVEREALYTKMDSLAMSSAPLVPLYYDEVVRFTRKNVEGLGINPINLLVLKRVKKTKD